MKLPPLLILVSMALAACTEQPEGDPILRAELGEDGTAQEIVPLPEPGFDTLEPEPEQASDCRLTSFEGVSLTHCIADPAQHRITTALAPASGEAAGSLAGFANGTDGDTVAFAMNGGMYGDDLKAIGYFVQDSDRTVELNRADGEGNFHLKPNGVFFGTDGTWRVLDSDTFFRTVGERPQFGTQSGPMLVIEGELHPEFQEDGPSRAIRNGVGIDEDGKAHFVISEQPISFGKFARYFRDELQTPNALFLDGNISSLWDPVRGRMDRGRVGPLLVVERR